MDKDFEDVAQEKPTAARAIRELSVAELDEVAGAGLIPGPMAYVRLTLALKRAADDAAAAYGALRR